MFEGDGVWKDVKYKNASEMYKGCYFYMSTNILPLEAEAEEDSPEYENVWGPI